MRLATCHRFRKGEGAAGKKRKEVEASVPARKRELGFGCPHVGMNAVAEVGKRSLGPKYARQTRSRKGRSGSSERGPSSEWASASETVGECIERKDVEGSGAPDKNGSESIETHGDVRASSSGLRGRVERPHGGRGTGVVMATGSYEGSLPREGILVCWKHRSSRIGVEGRLGGLPITTIRTHAQQDDGRIARTKVMCSSG